MATFPKLELDVLTLGDAMVAGYTANPTLFPHADLPSLITAVDDFRGINQLTVCLRGQAKQSTEDKDVALEALVANMTLQLAHAEVDTAANPVKLGLIGWGDKAPAQPGNPPSQPRHLEAILQGPGTVYLDWKAPPVGRRGGPVRTSIIFRREMPLGGGAFGPWFQEAMALDTHILLSNQTLRCEIEYRIVAVNIAGVSVPSNTAMVVL